MPPARCPLAPSGSPVMPVTLSDRNQVLDSKEIEELIEPFEVTVSDRRWVFPPTVEGGDGKIGRANISMSIYEVVRSAIDPDGVPYDISLAIHVIFDISQLFIPSGKSFKQP